jgi:hypothetical protein
VTSCASARYVREAADVQQVRDVHGEFLSAQRLTSRLASSTTGPIFRQSEGSPRLSWGSAWAKVRATPGPLLRRSAQKPDRGRPPAPTRCRIFRHDVVAGTPAAELGRTRRRARRSKRDVHAPRACQPSALVGNGLMPLPLGALTTGIRSPVAARHVSVARSCTPVPHPSPGGVHDEASTRVHFYSPARRFPSPAQHPGWNRNCLGFSPELHTPPPRRRRRMSGWG